MRRVTPTLGAAAHALSSAVPEPRRVAKLARPGPATSEPTFSVRLCMPFLRILSRTSALPPEDLARLMPRDLEARIPVSAALAMLDGAVALTRDPDLGLRAALEAESGEFDLLEYLACSATSVAESVPLLARYSRLLNDGLEVTLERIETRAVLHFASRVPLNRTAADFQLASFYRGFVREPPGAPSEVWLMHGEPADRTLAERAFAGARLRFSAPCDAIVFDAALVDQHFAKPDRKLHELLRRLAEERLAELPPSEPLTQRVRERLAGELASGDPSAEHIAGLLHMSRRTLVRRLEAEGSSFKAILDDLRSGLARRYLAIDRLGVTEVAALLGFSDSPAFTRAFRRWSGESPSEYRRSRRLVAN
ncbi:MAG TPA: AraC family transcriptional regulator ligand-binding domain-containing protein [Myxococcota bacterium]|nr:AraC family transcriptional regulator ligand-binding domain-containing protein [Myxococcota bacterium]